MSDIKEKCAVGGVLLTEPEQDSAAAHLYEVLYALQHRGSEASGIVTKTPDGPLVEHRQLGLVRDVYDEESMARLAGNLAVGHNRYSTFGQKEGHPQPVIDEGLGLAIAHNGNIPDTSAMDHFLDKHHLLYKHLNDSERMGLTIAQFMRLGDDLPTAIEHSYPLFNGAYSCVGVQDDTLFAFRDAKGIRPLSLGRFNNNLVLSSETCGLDILNARYDRDILPGELVTITSDGELSSKQLAEPDHKLDMFEFVYFARHDSKLYGKRVYEIRKRFGEQLALEHGALRDDCNNTLVVPVPDTAMPEAEGYAKILGLYKEDAIVKNRYIGRTFMQPTQEARIRQLRRKHNIISEPIKGKDIILIDDSIVRLNTMPNLVSRLRMIGARTVSVLVGSPPVRFPDYYGIDTANQKELAAANMTVKEMRNTIGCEYLGFLSLEGLVKATDMPAEMFNLSCFNGEYPIDIGYNRHNVRRPVSMEYVS